MLCFLFILLYHGVMIRQPCYLLKLFCFYHTRLKVCSFTIVCKHHFSISYRSGRSGASMLRPALVGPRYFYLIFVDQALPSAEPRTVIFSFLYIPPLDCWPIERPLHGPWNSDWYHFSVICTAVYPPCVVFLSARYSKRCVVPGLKLIFVTSWTAWTCRKRTMIGS